MPRFVLVPLTTPFFCAPGALFFSKPVSSWPVYRILYALMREPDGRAGANCLVKPTLIMGC